MTLTLTILHLLYVLHTFLNFSMQFGCSRASDRTRHRQMQSQMRNLISRALYRVRMVADKIPYRIKKSWEATAAIFSGWKYTLISAMVYEQEEDAARVLPSSYRAPRLSRAERTTLSAPDSINDCQCPLIDAALPHSPPLYPFDFLAFSMPHRDQL